jgi:hypothetical protein
MFRVRRGFVGVGLDDRERPPARQRVHRHGPPVVTDLLSDATGAFLGAGLLVAWAVYGWGSVRRIPGENRIEDTNA